MVAESSEQYIFAKSTGPIEAEDLSKRDPALSEVELQLKFGGSDFWVLYSRCCRLANR